MRQLFFRIDIFFARSIDHKCTYGITLSRNPFCTDEQYTQSPIPRAVTMKFWILACGALAAIAARAVYGAGSRRSRRAISKDQVSADWLATARIHEDQG